MVSTVSTRGVKFKFSKGEQVLCYEPDPTKAKVLYESKVLDLVVNRDDRGRKVPEYLVHFFGWNKSWDRRVREDLILPFNEENSELQAKLASDVVPTIKGKRKIKLPPLIKETLAKKQCSKTVKQKSEKLETSADSSSDTDSSDEEIEREIFINIPEMLKRQLEEDCKNITKRSKFVKLPCKPNIIAILEAFVKHLAAKLLCASPPKNGKQLLPDDVKNKLNLCKEAMDGIRVYFDFTLPDLLLYQQEKAVYHLDGLNCKPICSTYKWEPTESIEKVVIKLEKLEPETTVNSLKSTQTPIVKVELENILPARTMSIKSLRSQSTISSPTHKSENLINGDSEKSPVNLDRIKKEDNLKKSPKEKHKYTTTRVLRSSEKQKSQTLKEDQAPRSPESLSPPPPPPVFVSDSNKHSTPVCPTLTISLESTNLPRVTRKSTIQNMSPPRISSPTIPVQPPQQCTEINNASTSSTNPNRASTSIPQPSNCKSSSNSSSHSTFSNPVGNHQFHLVNNEALLQEILSWRLLPKHLYESIPVAPSLIYGPHHLLRLFVKLPELLSKMNISKKKVAPLIDILEGLLNFMMDKSNELFQPSAYVDDCDDGHEIDVCSIK